MSHCTSLPHNVEIPAPKLVETTILGHLDSHFALPYGDHQALQLQHQNCQDFGAAAPTT